MRWGSFLPGQKSVDHGDYYTNQRASNLRIGQ